MNGTVVVIGDVMTDILVRLRGPIRSGTDQSAQITTMLGGGGANQAAWLAACGVPVRLAARVGAADRAALTGQLGERGVEAWLGQDADNASGRLVCLIAPDGERSFLTSRGANAAFSAADLPDTLLEGAGWLHVSGYALLEPGSCDAVAGAMRTARAAGAVVSIDPGSSGFLADLGPERFFDAAAPATMIFPNADEAAILTRETAPDDQLATLLTRFEVVVLKAGAGGASAGCRDGRRASRAAHPPAQILDTTGAGDAFLAGFVADWRQNRDLDSALIAATRTAALAVATLGAQPPGLLTV